MRLPLLLHQNITHYKKSVVIIENMSNYHEIKYKR